MYSNPDLDCIQGIERKVVSSFVVNVKSVKPFGEKNLVKKIGEKNFVVNIPLFSLFRQKNHFFLKYFWFSVWKGNLSV